MSNGGSGVISVFANVAPAQCQKMCADYLAGRHAEAAQQQIQWLEVINNLFIEVNPIPVKTAMNMQGLNVGPCRLPLCEMADNNAATLRASMERAGLL